MTISQLKEDMKKKMDDLSKFVTEENEIISTTLDKEKTFIRESFEASDKLMTEKIDKGVGDLKSFVQI